MASWDHDDLVNKAYLPAGYCDTNQAKREADAAMTYNKLQQAAPNAFIPNPVADKLMEELKRRNRLETDSAARKEAPVYSGVLRYFPDALMEVARLSKHGNDKHNPGQPLHWAREKSSDHGDCIVRHQLEAGTVDTDGFLHDVKVAWRALAQLQLAIEARK